MGFFDDLFRDNNKKPQKQDSSFTFSWLSDSGNQNPIKTKKHKPTYKHLESYSSDGEADEDGFFDENQL